jgi:hypothetical protein
MDRCGAQDVTSRLIGALAIIAAAIATLSAGQSYALDVRPMQVDGRCDAIQLDGEIRSGEAPDVIKRIDTAAAQCATRNMVIGRMPGGSVNDALEIGAAIRAREYVTAMLPNTECYSACGLVYLGGVQRYWREGARFIIHRPHIRANFSNVADETTAYEELKGRLIRYVSDMGASPDYVDAMYAVSPPGHVTVNRRDMNAWALFMIIGLPF